MELLALYLLIVVFAIAIPEPEMEDSYEEK